MDLRTFKESVAAAEPPDGLGLALQALWWDAKGDWDKAHECTQESDDQPGTRVHAYLHRKEGDLSNAGYWYRRAQSALPDISLAEEWEQLADRFLREG